MININNDSMLIMTKPRAFTKFISRTGLNSGWFIIFRHEEQL